MTTPKSNGYKYQKLESSRNEIRLLRLLPADGNQKHKFIPACQIFHASLYERPEFVALSYVWGADTNQRVILVGNTKVRVNKNLHDALMVLRKPKEELVIWADALCINQADEKEKSWQVRLMAEIYREAYRTTAWLGAAEGDDDSVMDYLNSLGEKAEVCGMHNGLEPYQGIWQKLALQPRELPSIKSSTISIGMLVDAINSIFYSISGWHDQNNLLPVAGIKRFFTRPWWERVWVLQEITLAENAVFLCGNKRITRNRCSAALNAYCALRNVFCNILTKQPLSLSPYQLSISSNLFQHRPTIMLSSWKIYRSSKFPLAALLGATCVGSINLRRHGPHHLESTDPRDKIFALLGLAADRNELGKKGLIPDYSKTCKEVYTTAMVCLLQEGHISLLSFCQKHNMQSKVPSGVAGLPSWVPDWSLSITDRLQDVRDNHVTIYPEFGASGIQPRYAKITPLRRDNKIEGISLECHIYDEIHEAGSFPGRADSHEVPVLETHSWPVEWLVEILRLTYQGRQVYLDFSDRLRAAARTSIGGVCYSQEVEFVRVHDDRFLHALTLLEKSNVKQIKMKEIKRGISQLSKDRVVNYKEKIKTINWTRLGSEINGKSLGRLPFITRKGHLVLSSEHVKRGDFVAIIKGAQVPFILRRQSEGQYQLIGEAYVDGIMDGEAMKNQKWGEVHLF